MSDKPDAITDFLVHVGGAGMLVALGCAGMALGEIAWQDAHWLGGMGYIIAGVCGLAAACIVALYVRDLIRRR